MKQYNGEKAIISLTSWKARINTVCKTLFSLIDQCPGFHIVLVLSEEEFPKKEEELPENLKIFIDNDLIEVLWTEDNLKSHKKYFYTMKKYREVPIILADDDLFYMSNFAEKLYNEYLSHPSCIIASRCHKMKKGEKILPYRNWEFETKVVRSKELFFTTGQGVLFPPNCLMIDDSNLPEIMNTITADDVYLNALRQRYEIDLINVRNLNYKENLATISSGLYKYNVGKNANDRYIENFRDDFNKAFVHNIIGNACASSYLTKSFFNHQFINPFTYAIIDFESMYNLIRKYDTLDFSKYEFILESDRSGSLIIDGCVKVNYIHYKYDKNVDKKIVDGDEGRDFISRNIREFIIEKYNKRIKLMKRLNISPTFICASREGKNFVNDYSKEQILKLLNVDTTYKIIIASSKDVYFENTDKREFIKIDQGIDNNGIPLAKFIFTRSKILF